MRFLLLTICLFVSPALLPAQTLEHTLYIDFGPNDGEDGNATASPDINGHNWNNATDPSLEASELPLWDSEFNPTGYVLTVTNEMSSVGIENGGLLAPDVLLLNDLAIPTATQDYFLSFGEGAFTISNLNPFYGYRFTMFGSRNSPSIRITEYQFIGENTETGELQTSGVDIGVGTSSPHGNDSSTYTSDYIYPNAAGEITIGVGVVDGFYGYLNIMKMEAYSDGSTVSNEGVREGDNRSGSIRLFPNPANDVITVDFDFLIEEIIIFNSTGKLMDHSRVISKGYQLDVSNYVPGLYTLIARSYKGQITKLVIVE